MGEFFNRLVQVLLYELDNDIIGTIATILFFLGLTMAVIVGLYLAFAYLPVVGALLAIAVAMMVVGMFIGIGL